MRCPPLAANTAMSSWTAFKTGGIFKCLCECMNFVNITSKMFVLTPSYKLCFVGSNLHQGNSDFVFRTKLKVWDNFVLSTVFWIMKTNNFRVDLTDISATTKKLQGTLSYSVQFFADTPATHPATNVSYLYKHELSWKHDQNLMFQNWSSAKDRLW